MWNHNEKLNYNRLKMLNLELNEIHDSKAKLIQARSKANWIKKKTTDFFTGLENQHRCQNVINELK